MIQDISKRLLGDFATCLQAELTAPAAGEAGGGEGERETTHQDAKPVRGLSLLLSVLRERIRRFLGRRSGSG